MWDKSKPTTICTIRVLINCWGRIISCQIYETRRKVENTKIFPLSYRFPIGYISGISWRWVLLWYGNTQHKQTREDKLREKAKQREKLWIEELERRDAIIQARKQRLEESKKELRELAKQGFIEEKESNDKKED